MKLLLEDCTQVQKDKYIAKIEKFFSIDYSWAVKLYDLWTDMENDITNESYVEIPFVTL